MLMCTRGYHGKPNELNSALCYTRTGERGFQHLSNTFITWGNGPNGTNTCLVEVLQELICELVLANLNATSAPAFLLLGA